MNFRETSKVGRCLQAIPEGKEIRGKNDAGTDGPYNGDAVVYHQRVLGTANFVA